MYSLQWSWDVSLLERCLTDFSALGIGIYMCTQCVCLSRNNTLSPCINYMYKFVYIDSIAACRMEAGVLCTLP